MQESTKQFVNILESDAQLQSLLGGTAANKKIYPEITDQFEDFPCIVYYEVSSSFRTKPSNVEDSTFQFSIFTQEESGNKALIENITTRINALLNYYVQESSEPRIVYSILENKQDANEPDRRIFSKILTYRLYIRN